MKMLAIEMSTRRGSAAFFVDEKLVREEAWEEPQARHGRLFDVVPGLVGSVRDVDLFAVGRGPGAFSGIRVAITAAQAFALPFGRSVFAVSSGEALAVKLLAETRAPSVTIVGDARRGTLWYGTFGTGGNMVIPWSLTTVAELDQVAPADTVIASPDWDRLHTSLPTRRGWIEEVRQPDAREVGTIALARRLAGKASDPVEPIYMHPAV